MRNAILACLAAVAAAGCTQPKTEEPVVTVRTPSYSRPLPPGRSALRLVTDPARMPDIAGAYAAADSLLLDAIDHSLDWFKAPSSRQFFPFEGITHRQAEASLLAIKRLLQESPDQASFEAEIRRLFDVYESVGYDSQGTVLFTGYFAPIYRGSRAPSARCQSPLYRRPSDLETDPITGEPKGRRTRKGEIEPYYTRRELEEQGMLAGSELVWVESDLAAYVIHVNGSAKLRMEDGGFLHIGYAGKTDRPYSSLGEAMIQAGLLQRGRVNLPAIRQVFREQPERVKELMRRNQNYVFFSEYPDHRWPAGSLGVKVTPEASLATDKKIYPRGGLVLVDTKAITFSGQQRSFLRFMLDQDTGGAIQAPGRADIFMGVGTGAEILAGDQYAEGQLYYFFLKPEHVEQFVRPATLAIPRP